MNPEKPLSISDIARELNSGIVTLKFILKRFSPWLPFDRIDGHHYYSRNTIPVLIKVQESLEAGLLPSEIDQELKTGSQESSPPIKSSPEKVDPEKSDSKRDHDFPEHPHQDIRISKDGLTLIKSMFDDIAVLQNRVATAHEKRANAEEKKAVAIEKRAEAEEKKANAMNNIANALQEMNQHRRLDSPTREMARQAALAMTLDETNPDMGLADLEDTGDPGQNDYPEIFDSPDPPIDLLEASDIQMDDLSDLIEADILLGDPLVGVQNIPGDIMSHPPEDSPQTIKIEPELDDLAALIDQEPQPVNPTKEEKVTEIDDLARLLEPTPEPEKLDNLSALIDTISTQASPETNRCPGLSLLDDLSLLIDDSAPLKTPELDNLSLLIETPTTEESHTPVVLDDLSLLITPDSTVPGSLLPIDPIDDLGILISDPPSLKPDITPEENLKEYKAAVMKIIIGLKTENLSAQETTRRLNLDGVQTISGKSQWSEQSISQIYKFIDSAK